MRIKEQSSLLVSLAAALLLSAIVFVAAPSPFMAQSDTADDVQIGVVETGGDDRLNVRSGPGVNNPLVIKLESGTEVTIVEISDDGLWYKIEADDGEILGWVAREFILLQSLINGITSTATLTATVTLATSALPTQTPTATNVITPTADASVAPLATTTLETMMAPTVTTALLLLPSPTTSFESTPDISSGSTEEASIEVIPELTPEFSLQNNPESTLETTPESTPADGEDDAALSVYGPEMFPETFSRAQTTSTISPTPLATNEQPTALLPSPTPRAASDADDGNEATVTPTVTVQPTPSKPTAYTIPDRMNVRSGPGTAYNVITSVPAGSDFEILAIGPNEAWYEVVMEGQDVTGWLFIQLVTTAGSLDGLPQRTQDEVPPAPTPSPQAVSSAAVAVSAPAGGGYFGYGVQAHMLGGQSGAALNAIDDMGFNWVKQQVEWRLYESHPGARGYGELAGIVAAADARGINVLFSVVNAPPWAREDGFDSSVGGPPVDPQTYANFVGSMAGQFCGTSLKAIEIWNEQNLHYEWGNKPLNPAEYMELLKPAYNSIKVACPQMLVISGALTPAGSNGSFAIDDFAYLEGMYQNGLASYSDGIGAHPSGYNVPPSIVWEGACETIQSTGNSFNGACDTPHHSWSFRSTMEGYRNIMNVYGDSNKRIWPTEFGWAAGGAFDPRYMYANDNSFDEQSQWTVEAYTMMRNWGWVGPAFLWNLNFRVVADGTEKAQWGIVSNNYQPLPTYLALKSMPK